MVATSDAKRRIVGPERAKWINDCLSRYRAGASIRQIARDTGRSYGFVHCILLEGGATLRNRGGRRQRRTAAPREAAGPDRTPSR